MDESAAQGPFKFRFYEGGEEYMLLADVARFHKERVSTLLAEFPSLHRRQATFWERGVLYSNGHAKTPIVTLTRASEVNAIFNKADGSEQVLRNVPVREERPGVDEHGKPITLTTSNHVPSLTMRPATNALVSKPRNLLSAYYRYADGLASPSDSMPEVLAPIRIAIDQDGYKYQDTFTWNVNDCTIKPTTFAEMLVQDVELPAYFVPSIASSIERQLEDFVSLQEIPAAVRPVTVNIELQLGEQLLKDRFVWDPTEPRNVAEDFATAFCADMGVGGEIPALVAHCIREQVQQDRKALLTEDNVPADDHCPKFAGDVFRIDEVDLDSWTPSLHVLTQSEREKKQQEGERESRWRRRAQRETSEKAKPYQKVIRLPGARRGPGRPRNDERIVITYQTPTPAPLNAGSATAATMPPAEPSVAAPDPSAVRLGPTLPAVVRPIPPGEDELLGGRTRPPR
eukprot:m.132529 g.132529  ORF g.132529 m.132529 type:complete len:456 (+) comp9489_c0_seq7:50-1417(+)